jgi:hypothetical protein
MNLTCDTCQKVADVLLGTICNTCELWNCNNCIIIEKDYDTQIDVSYCELCFKNKNSEMRATCISCEHSDNIEEGIECHKCKHWICAECVCFKDDGNYYCVECNKS